MIKTKCKRKELYFHHIFVFIMWFIYNSNGMWMVSCSYYFCRNFIVVSGIDSIAM